MVCEDILVKWCNALGCDRTVGLRGARGYCPMHYKRLLNHGTVEVVGVPGTGKGQRKTHCKRGHPLSGDNLRVYQKRRAWGVQTKRECRECYNMHQRKYYESLARGVEA